MEKNFPNIKIDLIIVKEDNLPPLKWKIGRVIQIFPGSNKKVCLVKLKTAHGEITRPIDKLVLLMTENCND